MNSFILFNNVKEEFNHLKSKNKLENIKANYIIKKIFGFLDKKKSLYILKYNRNLQNRMSINVNDYKEYSEKYTIVDIDILPLTWRYGTFINIKEGEEMYYHIYFNDNTT